MVPGPGCGLGRGAKGVAEMLRDSMAGCPAWCRRFQKFLTWSTSAEIFIQRLRRKSLSQVRQDDTSKKNLVSNTVTICWLTPTYGLSFV